MSSAITTIRQLAVSTLTSDLTGVTVYDSRTIPVAPADLPAVNVTTPSWRGATKTSLTGPRSKKTLVIKVECMVLVPSGTPAGNEDKALEAARDALAWLVETTLLGSQAMRQYDAIRIVGDVSERDGASNQRIGVATLTFEIDFGETYDTLPTDDLDHIYATINGGGTLQAEVQVDV